MTTTKNEDGTAVQQPFWPVGTIRYALHTRVLMRHYQIQRMILPSEIESFASSRLDYLSFEAVHMLREVREALRREDIRLTTDGPWLWTMSVYEPDDDGFYDWWHTYRQDVTPPDYIKPVTWERLEEALSQALILLYHNATGYVVTR